MSSNDRMLEGMLKKRVSGDSGEVLETGTEMVAEKVMTIIKSLFQDDQRLWLGVLQIQEADVKQADKINFETMMRRFRELQRTKLENLNKGLVQQFTNMILEVLFSDRRNQGFETASDNSPICSSPTK